MTVRNIVETLTTLAGMGLVISGFVLSVEYRIVWTPALVAFGIAMIVLATEISE